MSDEDRFWPKVDMSGECWLWTAAKDHNGYGKFSVGGQRDEYGNRRNSMVSAHRFAYELVNGPIPKQDSHHGLCVLHKCDTPSCVRPAHLFLGTNAENVKDMDRKGRRVTKAAKGSAHVNAILTETQVINIYERYAAGGITQKKLACEYKVSLSTINSIINGRLWSHLNLKKGGN